MAWQHMSELLIQSAVLRSVGGGFLRALKFGVVFYFIVYLLERASGGTTKQYRSWGFLQDIFYWFYYRSGLNQLLFLAALFSLLGTRLAFLHLKIVDSFHPIVQGALWFLLADFGNYWVHRLQHASRFVWAFHSTHHAQEQLSFATTTRFHPVDHFISNTLKFVPQLTLGASPMSWLPLYLVADFLAIAQHSRITWRFGALSKVFVTPRFHSFHHSTDPRHYNKNFGGILSCWDYLFGTAVDAPQQPDEYGLKDVKMPTLMSTLGVPFLLLRQFYAKPLWNLYNSRKTIFPSSGSAEQHPDR
jgi:sterol desaturase/sphingolipid hydroxylase (fatty acid hydroxylase superfamily)